jgi:hypothetical protein
LRKNVLNGKDGILSDDQVRQADYENTLKTTCERVDEENGILAEMRTEELYNVSEALEHEHSAYFRRGIAEGELKAVRGRSDAIRQELVIAIVEARKIGRFKFKAKREAAEKVKELKSKLKDAAEQEELAAQKCKQSKAKAKADIKLAERHREYAYSLRVKRIRRIAEAVSDYIDERHAEGSQEADRIELDAPDCAAVQKEKIRVRALRDLIICASDDASAEGRVVEQIDDIIHSHTDRRWSDYTGGNDVTLCLMLQRMGGGYRPKKLGYSYKNLAKFTEQMSRREAVLGHANDLQRDARIHYDGEEAGASTAADLVV